MDREDLIIFMFPITVSSTVGASPLVAIGIGGFLLWLYRKATAHQPAGFLPTAASSFLAAQLHNPVVKKYFFLRVPLHLMVRLSIKIWIDAGSLPPPSYCKWYER